MRTFVSTAALTAVMALIASTAFAAPSAKLMTDQRLDTVVAGGVIEPPPPCECGCPPPPDGKEKGNNGWGNGEDGNNNGSFSGGSEASKSANFGVGPDKINMNPTTSSGR